MLRHCCRRLKNLLQQRGRVRPALGLGEAAEVGGGGGGGRGDVAGEGGGEAGDDDGDDAGPEVREEGGGEGVESRDGPEELTRELAAMGLAS
jgi:hypothetical protein